MPFRPRVRLVDVLLFLGAASWGSTYLCAKVLLSDPSYTPVLVATRMLISGAALALVAALARRRGPAAADIRSGIMLGLPLSVVFALENYGIASTSATNAGVVISLCIVMVPCAESAVRRTRLDPRLLVLALAAAAGAALLCAHDGVSAPSRGDLLILGAALARVVHVTASSVVQTRRPSDPFWTTAIQLCTVGVVFSLVCAATDAPVPAFFGGLTPATTAILLYLAVVAGAFVFVVQTWGIAVTSAAHTTLLLGTEPVWAALFGILLAGDQVGPLGILGIALTLSAVLVAQRISAASPRAAEGHEAGC